MAVQIKLIVVVVVVVVVFLVAFASAWSTITSSLSSDKPKKRDFSTVFASCSPLFVILLSASKLSAASQKTPLQTSSSKMFFAMSNKTVDWRYFGEKQ